MCFGCLRTWSQRPDIVIAAPVYYGASQSSTARTFLQPPFAMPVLRIRMCSGQEQFRIPRTGTKVPSATAAGSLIGALQV